MATEPQVPSDTDNWKVPTIVEIDSCREECGLSKRKFSDALDYSNGTGYHNAVRQNSISYNRLRTAVQYFRDHGVINYQSPTIAELAGAVRRRGICYGHFSHSIGYESSRSFGNVVQKEQMEVKRYRAAIEALDYYDENGIIPLPFELSTLALDS